jgi:hypothetical protein
VGVGADVRVVVLNSGASTFILRNYEWGGSKQWSKYSLVYCSIQWSMHCLDVLNSGASVR